MALAGQHAPRKCANFIHNIMVLHNVLQTWTVLKCNLQEGVAWLLDISLSLHHIVFPIKIAPIIHHWNYCPNFRGSTADNIPNQRVCYLYPHLVRRLKSGTAISLEDAYQHSRTFRHFKLNGPWGWGQKGHAHLHDFHLCIWHICVNMATIRHQKSHQFARSLCDQSWRIMVILHGEI